MSELDAIADIGRWALDASDQEVDDVLAESDQAHHLTVSFCEEWVKGGSQTYELQHSIAALLAATRSPDLNFERLPHRHFIVKVPAQFLPVAVNPAADTLICISILQDVAQIGLWFAGSAGWLAVVGDNSITEATVEASASNEERREWLLAIRMVSNVVAFITEHRECVERISKVGLRAVHSVRPPRDVVIDRAFRDRVSALVRAGTQAEVRSALAHMVRGHWRNQAVGEGRSERRLTWVRPHRRGDESLGVVVKRTERIS